MMFKIEIDPRIHLGNVNVVLSVGVSEFGVHYECPRCCEKIFPHLIHDKLIVTCKACKNKGEK